MKPGLLWVAIQPTLGIHQRFRTTRCTGLVGITTKTDFGPIFKFPVKMDPLAGLVIAALVIVAAAIMRVFIMAVDCCVRTRIHIEYVSF